MLRKHLIEKGIRTSNGFRMRGGEVTRIEGFTDAVFAFAVTLLIVSLEVPKTFSELLEIMQGLAAFAICFAMLIQVWHYHYVFFRRYGLQDGYITTISSILLFVVLFYIYPLKFVFTFVVRGILHGFEQYVQLPDGTQALVVERSQGSTMMIIYGIGFIAVFLLLALLYYHAYRRRRELDLNELEIFDTKASIQAFSIQVGVGIISVMIATIGGLYYWFAGMAYFLIGPALGFHGARTGKKRKKLVALIDSQRQDKE